MSNSSQQTDLSNISFDDTITITLPSDYSAYSSDSSMGTITLSGGNSYTITSGAIGSDFTTDLISSWDLSEEWINSFPEWSRVEDMCKHYPGLEIALRNFKTIYTLVKDDYDNPKTKD